MPTRSPTHHRKAGPRAKAHRLNLVHQDGDRTGQCARTHPVRPLARCAPTSSGLVIPSLHPAIATVIERDSSTADTITELLAAGVVTLDTVASSADYIVDDALPKLMGPVLTRFDDEFDAVQIFKQECGEYGLFVWDRCFDMTHSLDRLITSIKNPDALKWVGWLLNNHDGISPPSRWPLFLDHLSEPGTRYGQEDETEIPATEPDEIEKARQMLAKRYPYLINPAKHPINTKRALSMIKNKALAAILGELAASRKNPCGERAEPFIILHPKEDVVSHAIERLHEQIHEGNYDVSNNYLFSDNAKNITELKAVFSRIDAWLEPISKLQHWLEPRRFGLNPCYANRTL